MNDVTYLRAMEVLKELRRVINEAADTIEAARKAYVERITGTVAGQTDK